MAHSGNLKGGQIDNRDPLGIENNISRAGSNVVAPPPKRVTIEAPASTKEPQPPFSGPRSGRTFSDRFRRRLTIYVSKNGHARDAIQATLRIESGLHATCRISRTFLESKGIHHIPPETPGNANSQTHWEPIGLKWSPKKDRWGPLPPTNFHICDVCDARGSDCVLTRTEYKDKSKGRKSWRSWVTRAEEDIKNERRNLSRNGMRDEENEYETGRHMDRAKLAEEAQWQSESLPKVSQQGHTVRNSATAEAVSPNPTPQTPIPYSPSDTSGTAVSSPATFRSGISSSTGTAVDSVGSPTTPSSHQMQPQGDGKEGNDSWHQNFRRKITKSFGLKDNNNTAVSQNQQPIQPNVPMRLPKTIEGEKTHHASQPRQAGVS